MPQLIFGDDNTVCRHWHYLFVYIYICLNCCTILQQSNIVQYIKINRIEKIMHIQCKNIL